MEAEKSLRFSTPATSIKPDMHPFFLLREKLSLLQFDPQRDSPVSQQDFLKEYLQFYRLDFPDVLCKKHCIGTFEAANYTLSVQYWIPAQMPVKGTVFVLHGYYDHVGLFGHIIRFLLAQGFAVVAYDQPGHGLSSGEAASINHFSEYAEVLQQCLKHSGAHFPKPWHGIGQSTGAAVLLHTLMVEKMTNPFHAMVLLAPLIRPRGWNAGVWSYRLLRHVVKKIPRHYTANSNDESFVAFCKQQDPLQSRYLKVKWVGAMKEWLDQFPSLDLLSVPALLIQGDADMTVDWQKNVEMICRHLPLVKVIQISGARHQLVNESESLREQIFTPIGQFLLASE